MYWRIPYFLLGSCDAAIPPIDDFGPTVNFEAAFDGEQGIGFGFRPAAFRPTMNHERHPVGEATMAMLIAGRYGKGLLPEGRNIEASKLSQMMMGYPSHGYVIDRNKASELFCTVLEPTSAGKRLEERLGNRARQPDYLGSGG